jgi:hypothetical protein
MRACRISSEDEDPDAWGLLDKSGKEVLKLRFSVY